MDQQKRLFIAIALCFGLTLVFSELVWKPEAEQARLAALDAGAQAALSLDAGPAAPTPNPTPEFARTPVGPVDAGPPVPEPEVRRVEQLRATMKLAFSSEGAGLVDAILLGAREHVQQDLSIAQGFQKLGGKVFPAPPQMDLADPLRTTPQFAISIAGPAPLSPQARYAVAEESRGRMVFTATQGPWQVTKTLTWDPEQVAPSTDAPAAEKNPRGYTFDMVVALKNLSAAPQTGELGVHSTRAIQAGSEVAPSLFSGIGNQASVLCRTDTVHRRIPGALEGGVLGCGGQPVPLKEHQGTVAYVGIDQQYFLSAVWPATPRAGRCVLEASDSERTAALFFPVTVGPGETTTHAFGMFLGPKDLELLANVSSGQGAAAVRPGLDETVDLGWWAFICKGLLWFMRLFHRLGNNWGIAIILLTVLVKVVLLPLTHRQMVSMEQMKKLQPKVEAIRKKFPDDRERQNAETMKLYQEAKVNPLGGCLPLVVQMPIWYALFTTLRTSYELYGEPFFGVWADLTTKDPTYIFPTLLGVTMIVTQRLQPQMVDKSQAFLLTWVMPVFFTAMMMNYPAGLSLYIFTNNLLSIGQQYALRRYLERTGVSAPKK